jgi:hypothetical protein
MDDLPPEPIGEEPKPVEAEPKEQPACAFCGGTTFEWGYLIDVGMGQSSKPGPLKFVEEEFRWRDQVYSPRGRSVDARVCKTCGNTQLFVDVNKPK